MRFLEIFRRKKKAEPEPPKEARPIWLGMNFEERTAYTKDLLLKLLHNLGCRPRVIGDNAISFYYLDEYMTVRIHDVFITILQRPYFTINITNPKYSMVCRALVKATGEDHVTTICMTDPDEKGSVWIYTSLSTLFVDTTPNNEQLLRDLCQQTAEGRFIFKRLMNEQIDEMTKSNSASKQTNPNLN